MRHALVLHASCHGSTAQAAEHIAERLERHGYQLQVRPVRYQRSLVGPEHLVVLGIAVHRGRCHPEARRFLKRHRRDLADRPLALFALAVGPDPGPTPELMLSQLVRSLDCRPRAAPLSTVVFTPPEVPGAPGPEEFDPEELDLRELDPQERELDRPSIERWADALVRDL
ncbi:MAG: menaquinone-dependent protoporphyrinogen oxidase [Actinomycetota bacterium]|nr:menaquinone-dependent protoporphyrinogen oxidase [Actinomycetota bacterium]